MKTLLILLFISSPLIVFGQHELTQEGVQRVALQLGLERNKAFTDKYLNSHKNNLIVLAKVTGKDKLVRVVANEKWPDNTEDVYNILKDDHGHIILIAAMPYSESGDWYIEYRHYFDDQGKTFVFTKTESIFDDNVKGGVVRELLSQYYNGRFEIISHSDKLTDANYNPISQNKKDFDFRDYDYHIYKDVKSCLLGYQIKL